MICSADYRAPKTIERIYHDQELAAAKAQENPHSALYRVSDAWRPYLRRGSQVPPGAEVLRAATTPLPVSTVEEPEAPVEASA